MRCPGLLILAVLAALPTACSSASKEGPTLDFATLALAKLPPPGVELVRALSPFLEERVEGLGAASCRDMSAVHSGRWLPPHASVMAPLWVRRRLSLGHRSRYLDLPRPGA